MQVNSLNNPSTDEFRRALESLEPSFLYLRGEQHEDGEELGSLVWRNTYLSTPDDLCALFGSTLPSAVSH